jgi:excisionase family DNA binding protein
VKIPGGILLSPATCAAIGPALLDSLAAWHVNGLTAPKDVRQEIEEVAELGRKFQAATLQKRGDGVRPDARCVDSQRSPVAHLPLVTCSSTEAAKRLGIGIRAVQRRAQRGSLHATRGPGGELCFSKAEVDRLARKETA